MPNGAQAQAEEEEVSGGESQEEWESDADEGDEDAGSDEEEEEEEVAPPRSEWRSKLAHDPAADRGKGVVPLGSRRNALGQLHRRRLKRRRSNPERSRQNWRRPYRR